MTDSSVTRWRIRWTTDAANDLEQIFHHIIRDNPTAARNVIRTITEGIGKLKAFPNLGRSGQVEGTRGDGIYFVALHRCLQGEGKRR